jgi:conjugal transfer pilus assembly protein TraB
MANINKLVKNKQFMWLGVIAVSAVAIIGGGMYLSDLEVGSDDAAQTQNEPAPDMTGVVDSVSIPKFSNMRQLKCRRQQLI